MTYVETRMNVWEALAGRAPGEPGGPADPGLWGAVVDRLDPASARPVLRAGIEAVQLTAARGDTYIMLRSPDGGTRAGYLRLTPEEWQLALLMDGRSTVTMLVAEFARIAGRLAPDQVRRVVADLAGNRMLDELPMDAFRPLQESRRKPLPERVGNGMLAAARGRKTLVFHVDGLITALYRAGGRFLFGTGAFVVTGLLGVLGIGLFVATWARGSRSLFLTGDSYLLGAVVLVVLNGIVLVTHELARALATKATGREVPAAGLLIYFGIPSVFVDTTDVWMAGRRARLLVAASGPASALFLGGLVQLGGLAVPAFAGLAFKLAFLWYVNAFFQLSPLLPLDGQYLLMDWLEIPQLRARGLAWAGGRLRGRSPRWSALDREGRLIALYGILSIAWLAMAAVLTFLVFDDRISGLATGLWQAGLLGGLLLLLIVLGLGAPVVFFVLGRLARWWARTRRQRAENDRETDVPRRLAALRASDLGGLPEATLAALATRARWVHPPAGRQLIQAGGSQSAVYVVVDGALQGRKPGDPPGSIRYHVGPGGVVGLVNAIAGRSTQLDWHTAGTTLLYIPAATVASVVGPLPGPPPQDRAEAEALFADTPALAGLAVDQRLALIASAHPVDLEPGAPVILPGPTHAVVVESGVIGMSDGVELRRGTLVGPVGDGRPGMVAQTLTPVRIWVLPDASDLPPLVGSAHRPGSAMPVGVLRPGAPAPDAYPPLAVPPGPPDGPDNQSLDRRFESRLWWLIVLLLVMALVLVGISFRPGPAWAEMPRDQVLLTVDRGHVNATVGGVVTTFDPGDEQYLGQGARVEVPAGSTARLVFPGGGASVLCTGARVQLGSLAVAGGRHQAPRGTLTLQAGRVLADTTGTSGAFQPLRLTVARASGDVVNSGAAWYAVDPGAVTVSTGEVSVGGTVSKSTGKQLTCGDGVAVTPPSTEGNTPSEEPSTTGTDAPLPSDSASVAPAASETSATATTAPAATTAPTEATTQPTTATTTTGPPATTRPPTSRPTTTTPTTGSTTTSPTPTQTTTEPTTTPTTDSTTPESSSVQASGTP
ncbi:cyclic nucleotide-binding protein [Actinoplanes sp. KI2]|uniref:cyclic nucleotide-binding protein n=1 Tax=Actinoplanes sp. KI2 TaxID=2983315 RepID=UPI0021D5EA9C|nr:cyclic nucleotide-binding protein [Actinoplanes sp. KI2]MCU7724512.1 cyclic nucleotide-binding protein [Actinoplanes sp. KI2]